MDSRELIDTSFDFRSDTPEGRDPDGRSPTLRRYHEVLWSKPLPGGQAFELTATTPGAYLHHRSALGEFILSSDTATQSYGKVRRVAYIRDQIPRGEIDRFRTKTYSIGNMVLFPGRRIGGKWTINQARGCSRQIGDRFDLTLECIRLHYSRRSNPLASHLTRYAEFFNLFGDFRGYVDFFLLGDLVTHDGSAVKRFLPFVNFDHQSPYPDSVDAFRSYFEEVTTFIDARNQRILEYCRKKK